MSRIMRTGVYATGLRQSRAQIAGSGFLPDNRPHRAARFRDIRFENREGMHIDVAVRAIFCAKTATDAPILDHDFKR